MSAFEALGTKPIGLPDRGETTSNVSVDCGFCQRPSMYRFGNSRGSILALLTSGLC
jgi:hypothetical protein